MPTADRPAANAEQALRCAFCGRSFPVPSLLADHEDVCADRLDQEDT